MTKQLIQKAGISLICGLSLAAYIFLNVAATPTSDLNTNAPEAAQDSTSQSIIVLPDIELLKLVIKKGKESIPVLRLL